MVGILALQGDFSKHKNILNKLAVDSIYVKDLDDLRKTNALIIPGGESSTLSLLINRFNLRQALCDYSKVSSIFGTCAGMIMLSTTENLGHNVNSLNIMDFKVSRNSWGSQVCSFEKKVNLNEFRIDSFNAVFIRAPKVLEIGENIKVDYLEEEPIILEDDMHIACSFHPELEEDIRIHKYFLNKFYHEK